MFDTTGKGIMSEANREQFRSIRESLDKDIQKLAPDLLRNICPGCKHYTGSRPGNGMPCALYSTKNVYFNFERKCFWCKHIE